MRAVRRGAFMAAALAGAWPAQAGQDSAPAKAPPEAAACLPGDAPNAEEPASPPVLLEGLGYAGIAADTQNEEAKRWFEQGVRLIWAYDEVEAIRAFEQAQKLDPSCAMCFWGEAWARGPTLNLQPRTDEHEKASAAARKAATLAGKLGPRDRALVQAMLVRTGGKGRFRGKAYAKAMTKLAARFPDEDAVLVMAADSHMIVSEAPPPVGSPSQRWLETVIARNPGHSGAIHLYIHLTDYIDRQKLAEKPAERLARLAPGASHLIHMPSHTFYGVGRYGDAAAANVAALAADRAFVAKAKPAKSNYRVGLYAHNSHFAMESALMRGDGRTALEVAEDFRARYPAAEDRGFRPIVRAATWYAEGLHAPVEKVLAAPQPDGALMKAMRLYARGEALARKGDAAGVRAEAAAIAAFLASPDARGLGSKAVEALVKVTQHVLEGRAAMLAGDHQAAETAFRAGMTAQETAGFGTDPPPFWYPVRRSLAAAMLARGDAEGARRQLTALFEKWPGDPLALLTLSRVEAALGRTAEAESALARARAGWNGGDVSAVPATRI